MREAFDRIKVGVETGAVMLDETAVILTGTHMQTRSRDLVVSTPCTVDAPFVVSSVSLQNILSRMSAARVSVGDAAVTFIDGPQRTRTPRLADREPYVCPPVTLTPVSGALSAAVRLALRFVGDDDARPWTRGALVRDGNLYATNNVVLVECVVGDTPFEGLTLPHAFMRALVRRGPACVSVGYADNLFVARFADGGWCSAGALVNGMPGKVADLMATAYVEPEDECTDEWRSYVENAALLVEKCLTITPDRLIGARGLDTTEAFVETAVDGAVHFDPKPFAEIARIATHIDLTRYPSPTPFKREGLLRGVVAGQREPVKEDENVQ